jgi:PAS domain S-box-containing protein
VFWPSDPATKKMVYFNQAFAQMWGRDPKDLDDRFETWFDGIHEDDRARVSAAFNANGHASTYDTEYRVVRPDGSMCWLR